MSAVGGDILEVTYSHPTIGSGTWYPKSSEDSNFDPGGIRKNDDAESVDGGGKNIIQMNRKRWIFESNVSWDSNVANELDQADKLAESPVEAEWTITHINGTVWRGLGSVVGDVVGNGNTATMAVKLSGGAKLKKI